MNQREDDQAIQHQKEQQLNKKTDKINRKSSNTKDMDPLSQVPPETLRAIVSSLHVLPLPQGLTPHDVEPFMPHRKRPRGTMHTAKINSFAEYVTTHAEEGATVFVDIDTEDRPVATAVLNLGNPTKPGHADNLAIYNPEKSAAYKALTSIADGTPKTQEALADFIRDWHDNIGFLSNTRDPIDPETAMSAILNFVIEVNSRVASNLGGPVSERSTNTKRQLISDHPIPSYMVFSCVTFAGLDERDFECTIKTQEDQQMVIQITKHDQHREEVLSELSLLVSNAFNGFANVLMGSYTKS